MMSETEGTKESQPERAISVGQEFNLVSPDAVIPIKGGSIARFILRVEGLNIPITVFIVPAEGIPLLITPFNLEVSDVIDVKDYNPEERRLKLEALSSVGLSPEVKKNFFRLEIGQDSSVLNEAGLNKVDFEGYNRFPPETRRILEGLRLSLVFPNRLSFEAMPIDYILDFGGIAFNHYYPADFLPLPKVDVGKGAIYEGMHKGYYLGVPADPEKLSQIKAKFFLIDEEFASFESEPEGSSLRVEDLTTNSTIF